MQFDCGQRERAYIKRRFACNEFLKVKRENLVVTEKFFLFGFRIIRQSKRFSDILQFLGYARRRDVYAHKQAVAESEVEAEFRSRAHSVFALWTGFNLDVLAVHEIVGCALVRRFFRFVLELDVGVLRLRSQEQVADVGDKVFLFETADLHDLAIHCVDKVCVELEQQLLRIDGDHKVCIILHGFFNRFDVVRSCSACLAVCCVVHAEILAEQVLEHTAEIEISNGNLRAVAEYAEIRIQRVAEHVHAQKRLLGCDHRAVRLGNDVLDKTQAQFHIPVGKIDVCNKVKREIGHVFVAELVDDVEFERRAAYRAVGADKTDDHVKQG